MSATGSRQDGFTLIEMLVVVAVTALVGGLMFPRLQAGMAAQEFRGAASSVTLALKRARATAVAQGKEEAVAISGDGHSLLTSSGRLDLPTSVSLLSQPSNLVFFADGTASSGMVELSGGGRRLLFQLHPATGLVRMIAP